MADVLHVNQLLKRIVAQIHYTIGWDTMDIMPMEIIIDILDKYLRKVTRTAQSYAELRNRAQGNLQDVLLTFECMNINLEELREYVKSMDPIECVTQWNKNTIKKESNLQFLRPNNIEVFLRPSHVENYLPPMYPEYQ